MLDEERVIEVFDVAASDDRNVVVTEDQVGGRDFAEVVIEGAHGQPMIVQPRLDPMVGLLLGALGERQPRDDPRGYAAMAKQGGEQPTLGRGVAGLVLETIGGASGDVNGARLVGDLLVDEME